MQRDTMGIGLKARLNEIRAVDDTQFAMWLKKPFPLMQFSLASSNLFVLPARVAKEASAFTFIKDFTGSGPFVYLNDEWVSGSRAAFRRNERYIPRQERSSLFAGGKAVHVDRVEWLTIPDPSTAVGALLKGD